MDSICTRLSSTNHGPEKNCRTKNKIERRSKVLSWNSQTLYLSRIKIRTHPIAANKAKKVHLVGPANGPNIPCPHVHYLYGLISSLSHKAILVKDKILVEYFHGQFPSSFKFRVPRIHPSAKNPYENSIPRKTGLQLEKNKYYIRFRICIKQNERIL